MSDRESLLAAIISHPDEDTPRLVYADWLDEHGEAKRAAYIRAWVEYHRVEHADTATNTVYDLVRSDDRTDWSAVDADLGARRAAVKAAYKRSFKLTPKTEGVPRIRGVSFYHNQRGFYEVVRVRDVAAFIAHADAIFRTAPITELVFEQLTADQAAAFVRSGHFAQIRRLELLSGVEPEALRVLGSDRAALGVRTLAIPNSESGTAVVSALAASRYWTGVERFEAISFGDENRTAPTPDGVNELLSARPFPNLRRLEMWASELNDATARVLARTLPELRFADLAINHITGAGAEALAASKTLRHLRHLDIATCDVEDGSAIARLITTKNLPNLTVLRVDGSDWGGPDPKVLAKPGRGPTLRALDVGNSGITPAGIEALARCPAVGGVWYLTMDLAGLEDEHLERFVRHAAFEHLAHLDICDNALTARGARALAGWPGAATLQWLDIGGNALGQAGAKALAASPHLTKLKHINFTGRGTAVMKKRFKKAFQ